MNRTLTMILLVGCATGAPHTDTTTTTATPNMYAVDLAARRAQALGWLHDYMVAGAYPTDAFGRPASVFVDDHGVRCPMAELVHKSGRDDLVDAVHRESNAVRLADVHVGPLRDWMLSSGLTEEKIALVQGAANIDMGWMEAQPMELQLAEGRAQVRGKLETAEMALRQNTAHGLNVALARLTASPDVLARSPAHGDVVPKDAVAAAPAPAAPPKVTFARGVGWRRGY